MIFEFRFLSFLVHEDIKCKTAREKLQSERTSFSVYQKLTSLNSRH